MPTKKVLVVRNTGRRYPIKRVSKPIKQYVKRQIDGRFENQFKNLSEGPTAAAYDSVFLEELSTGEPEGEKIELKSIKSRMLFKNPASAGAVHCRVVIFQWYQDNEVSVPAVADIIEGAPLSANLNVINPLEHLTFNNRAKAKLIKDFTLTLGEATATDGSDQKLRSLLITPKMLGRKYQHSTGSTTYKKNAIYVMVFSSVASASSPPTVTMYSQINFKGESAA